MKLSVAGPATEALPIIAAAYSSGFLPAAYSESEKCACSVDGTPVSLDDVLLKILGDAAHSKVRDARCRNARCLYSMYEVLLNLTYPLLFAPIIISGVPHSSRHPFRRLQRARTYLRMGKESGHF